MDLNKRGQGLSITTLILIILGVLILVILILGFTLGWSKIFPFISPSNNVKDAVDKCNLACQTDSKFDFCTTKRDVKVEQAIGTLGTKFSGSCNELSYVASLGISSCSAIDCGDVVYSKKEFADSACGDRIPLREVDGGFKCAITPPTPAAAPATP